MEDNNLEHGNIRFGGKEVKIWKIGTGLKHSPEMIELMNQGSLFENRVKNAYEKEAYGSPPFLGYIKDILMQKHLDDVQKEIKNIFCSAGLPKNRNITMLEKALEFATIKHKGQIRKYDNEPYITHPIAVMNILKVFGFHETILCAALLHDVVEDTPTPIQEIENNFGIQVSRMVQDLTDVYTHERFPNIRRLERKKLECYRLWQVQGNSKSIKLADMIHNTKSIVEHDKDFAKVFIMEMEELLKVLDGGDQRLMDIAVHTLFGAKKVLGL